MEAMDNDVERWRQSYVFLPTGAGEIEIANADTSALEGAHRLMAGCTVKPPPIEDVVTMEEFTGYFGEPVSEGGPLEADPLAAMTKRVTDDGLRYARVCRELARRQHLSDPDLALRLLDSAVLPGSCRFAFEAYAGLHEWQTERLDQARTLLDEIRRHEGEFLLTDDGRRLMRDSFLQVSLMQAGGCIHELLVFWNAGIRMEMAVLHGQMGHTDEAAALMKEQVEFLYETVVQDGDTQAGQLILEGLSGLGSRPPITIERAGEMVKPLSEPEMLSEILQRVRSIDLKTSSFHDRMDIFFEKLIDLDQRSDSSWQQVYRTLNRESEYEEIRRGIEGEFSHRLGTVWKALEAHSRDDLVDAEYIYEHSKARRRWWMPALGYGRTIERELRASYRCFPTAALRSLNRKTLGEVIELLQELRSRLASKSFSPSQQALLRSIDVLSEVNRVRNRAAHPEDQDVSRDDVDSVRRALLGEEQSSLLATIVNARLGG